MMNMTPEQELRLECLRLALAVDSAKPLIETAKAIEAYVTGLPSRD